MWKRNHSKMTMESFEPTAWNRLLRIQAISSHREVELLQLDSHQVFLLLSGCIVHGGNRCVLETVLVAAEFIHEESLSHPSPAIYCYQLGPILGHSVVEFFQFVLSSNHSNVFLATNIINQFYLAKQNFIFSQINPF